MTSTIEEYLENKKYEEITNLCLQQEKGFAQKKAETLLKYINKDFESKSKNIWVSDYYLENIILNNEHNYRINEGTPYLQITNVNDELSYLDQSHHYKLIESVKQINQKYEKLLEEEEEKLSKMTEGEICEYYQQLNYNNNQPSSNKSCNIYYTNNDSDNDSDSDEKN